jgi:hypothetical protein
MKSVHKHINEDISCSSNYYNYILIFCPYLILYKYR